MREILKYIPWSGVGFILVSIVFIVYWMNHQQISFIYLILSELVLAIICFYGTDKEAQRK
jgi:hypothetical protein